MNHAVDYNEEKMTVSSWEHETDLPQDSVFSSFFAEKPPKNQPTEADFIENLKTGDVLYLLGTSVNETLCFIAAQRGATVLRIFAPDFKKIKEDLGIKKNEPAASALYYAALHKHELFRAYIPATDEDYLLKRWVRVHYRFQKRFRTGTQVTLGLLEKEVKKLKAFGYLENSKAAAKVAERIEKVLHYAQTLEDELLSAVEELLKTRPLWKQVLKNKKGIGVKIASKIICSGPRARWANRDHFIASIGLHVKDGMAVRRKAGESLARESLLFDAFLQYMRLLHMHDCPERDQYRKKKKDYLDMGWPLWRADKAGRRWVATHLAREIWRESKGLW